MPEGSHLLIPHDEPQVEPDFFAYYTREIEELFSQKEGHNIPSLSNVKNDDIGDSDCKGNEIPRTSFARKLFCNGVGDSLSGLKKERLKASLKQSVTVLGQETDETLESVLYVMKMKNQLYVKERFTKSESPSSADFDSNKKRKMSSSLSPGSDVIQSQPLGILSWEEASSSEGTGRKDPNIVPSEKRGQGKRTCIYCKATSTPQWRPGPDGRKNLCNACGLRFRKKKLFLPEVDELEESTEASDSEGIDRKYRSLDSLEESQSRGLHSSCSNCKTTSTPQRRGGPDGQKNLCNACGIRNKRKKSFLPELDKVDEQAEFPLELDKVEEQTELDKGLRSLLGIDESIPKETLVKYADELVKKYSDELHAKMENMEHQLEKYLGVIMSNCRKMTLEEKLNLRKLIQNLPQKNLDQIVEIILQARKLPEGHSCNMLHIDLENEDNVTLWRLYYYVEAVERARHLASVESSN